MLCFKLGRYVDWESLSAGKKTCGAVTIGPLGCREQSAQIHNTLDRRHDTLDSNCNIASSFV